MVAKNGNGLGATVERLRAAERARAEAARAHEGTPAQKQAKAPEAPAEPEKAQAWTAKGAKKAGKKYPLSKDTLEQAVKLLGKTKGGEPLKKLLQKKALVATDPEKAQKEFEKLADSLSADDRALVETGLYYAHLMGEEFTATTKEIDKMLEKSAAKSREHWQQMISELEK